MGIEWIVSSCAMILLVVLIRAVFRKKIQPHIRYVLWLAVAFRLLLPFSFPATAVSVLNFLPFPGSAGAGLPNQAAGGLNGGDEAAGILPGRMDAERGEEGAGMGRGLVLSSAVDSDAGGIREGDSIESVWEKDKAGSIPEGNDAGGIWKISDAESIQKGNDAEDIREKDSIESVQEKGKTENIGKKDSIEGAQEKGGGEEGAQVLKEDAGLKGKRTDAGMFPGIIWMSGAALCGFVFLAVNLDYGRRLKRSRRRMEDEKLPGTLGIPVYIAEMIRTPCMFGLLHPAVYVTERVAGEEKMLAYVLCHENIHYRHRDNWWALVRNLCLCLHWYNPFVWMAARLSRQDAELACDEKAVEALGRERRVDYGRALLELGAADFSGMGGWRISTTLGGSKRQMKERLQMLVDSPGRAVGVQVLLAVLMVFVFAVAFTGRDGQSFAASERGTDMERLEEGISSLLLQAVNAEAVPGGKRGKGIFAGESGTVSLEMRAMEKGDMAGIEISSGSSLALDLNFDGWEDLCVAVQYDKRGNISYDCMLWNPQTGEYGQSVTIDNVDTDESNRWITSRVEKGDGKDTVTYYRYDDDNQLRMLRYVEENRSEDAVFAQLDLTYVEGDGPYDLDAVVDGTGLHKTMLAMAERSLEELYRWTGEKVSTACFQVTNMGDVVFGVTPEDILHSRIFFSRTFGADTEYNLSGYEKCISSFWVTSGRSVWYSPVLWRVFPEDMDALTDEEVVRWYFERIPDGGQVKSIVKRYEDMWTIQAESGSWFEVCYDAGLREIWYVTGPYPDFPEH